MATEASNTAQMISLQLPVVAIVILNWNGKADTMECLSTLGKLDYPNYKIVLVDNGSTDGSEAEFASYYPDIPILQTGENLGYAGGNNVGIRWALEQGADYVLVLNNDTIVSPQLVNAFINAKALLPPDSVLGAKIFYYDKPDILWFAGGSWNKELNTLVHIGAGQKDNAFNEFAEVDYVTGCALFASAKTFNKVGLLDESFFLTYEETDWCYRARKAGHKCIYVPEATLWHKVSSSFGGADSPLVNYFMVRNKLLWAKKHLPKQAMNRLHKENYQTLRQIFLSSFVLPKTSASFLRRLVWAFASWKKTISRNLQDPITQSTLIALRDYYFGRFGNCPPKVRALSSRKL